MIYSTLHKFSGANNTIASFLGCRDAEQVRSLTDLDYYRHDHFPQYPTPPMKNCRHCGHIIDQSNECEATLYYVFENGTVNVERYETFCSLQCGMECLKPIISSRVNMFCKIKCKHNNVTKMTINHKAQLQRCVVYNSVAVKDRVSHTFIRPKCMSLKRKFFVVEDISEEPSTLKRSYGAGTYETEVSSSVDKTAVVTTILLDDSADDDIDPTFYFSNHQFETL